MCSTKKEKAASDFEELRYYLNSFYCEGMPLDTLAHRLRTNAEAFRYLLKPFVVTEPCHDS